MSLTRDLSYTELMYMRENEGMSNREIADTLDVSYQSVLRVIGKQPSGIRKNTEKQVVQAPAEPGACLTVTGRVISLTGEQAKYTLDGEHEILLVSIDGNVLQVPFGQIGKIVSELASISRNIHKVMTGAEMW